jgi:hypothetical protein
MWSYRETGKVVWETRRPFSVGAFLLAAIAFSSEVVAGSRGENASKQKGARPPEKSSKPRGSSGHRLAAALPGRRHPIVQEREHFGRRGIG